MNVLPEISSAFWLGLKHGFLYVFGPRGNPPHPPLWMLGLVILLCLFAIALEISVLCEIRSENKKSKRQGDKRPR